MIDPNLPLELDDGTPVTLFRHMAESSQIWVRIPEGCSTTRKNRPEPANDYWYNAKTGVFGGGTKRLHKLLRNADERDLYERDLEQ